MPQSEPETAGSAAAADSPARNTRRAAAARRAAEPPPLPPPPPPALAYGEAPTERLPTAPTPARPPRSALESDADSPSSPRSSAGPVTRLFSRLRLSLGRRLHAAFFSVRAADDTAAGANAVASVAAAAPAEAAVAEADDNDPHDNEPPPVDGPCTLSPTAPAFLFPSKRCALLSAPEEGSEDDTQPRVEGALVAQKSPPRLVFKPDGGGAAQTLLLENVRFFAISDDEHRVQLLLLCPRGEGSPLEPFCFSFRVAASAAALAAALGDAMAWHEGFFDQQLVLSTEGDGRTARPRSGGSRGDIYYGAWRAEAEERVAVKLARSPQVSLSEELRVMRALCPRVGLEDEAASLCIPLVGGYSTGRGPALLKLRQCIVTPWMWGGSLLECLHYRAQEGDGLWLATPRDGREDEAQGVARRILAACRYMHEKGWVHDDIQPRSVLLEKRITFMRHGSVVDGGPDPLTLKIADFGRAREASRAPHPISREAYASPERKAFAAAGAAAAAPPPGAAGDVWSIGVVLYEIMAQDLAAEGDGVRVAIQEGLDGPADEGPLERLVGASRAALRQRGPLARELLRLLLQRDADERPSAEDALSHPWLTEADGGESDGDSS